MTNQVERLQQVEAMLSERGVLDAKFFFGLDASSKPLSEVKESVAQVLEAYCAGKFTDFRGIDDRYLAQ
jgi:uncharacterized protein (UPF0210 family)